MNSEMTWNHRIVKRKYYDKNGSLLETSYYIVEAYYDENKKVFAITEDPVGVRMEEDWIDHNSNGVYGESTEDGVRRIMGEQLDWMRQALSAPILDYDQIPEPGAANPVDAHDDEDGEENDGE